MLSKEITLSNLDPLLKLKKSICTLLASLAHHKAVVRGAVESMMGQMKLVVYVDPDAYKSINLLNIPTTWDGYSVVTRPEVPNGGENAIYKDHWKPEEGMIIK